MSRWKLTDEADEFELAAGVPDAVSVSDVDNTVIAWDEAAAHQYELAQGLPTACDSRCADRKHVLPM